MRNIHKGEDKKLISFCRIKAKDAVSLSLYVVNISLIKLITLMIAFSLCPCVTSVLGQWTCGSPNWPWWPNVLVRILGKATTALQVSCRLVLNSQATHIRFHFCLNEEV